MRHLDSVYKLKQNIRIAMLWLEDEDAVNAELYIKKASSLIAGAKNVELELKYKTSYARILDAKRRFVEAATCYYELSQTSANLRVDGVPLRRHQPDIKLHLPEPCFIHFVLQLTVKIHESDALNAVTAQCSAFPSAISTFKASLKWQASFAPSNQRSSHTSSDVVQVGEDELSAALEAAVTCCILAAAGPQRSRVLANLYKDARVSRLKVFPFLEKVYLERILRPHEREVRQGVQSLSNDGKVIQVVFETHLVTALSTARGRMSSHALQRLLHAAAQRLLCASRSITNSKRMLSSDVWQQEARLTGIKVDWLHHTAHVPVRSAVVSNAQVAAFSDMLRPHQRAKTADGTTVLERAVIEHNLAAAAKLYLNIATAELGALLGTSAERAEEIAARMLVPHWMAVCNPDSLGSCLIFQVLMSQAWTVWAARESESRKALGRENLGEQTKRNERIPESTPNSTKEGVHSLQLKLITRNGSKPARITRSAMPAQGSIDQVEGMIRFDAHSEELLHWDDQIQSICTQLNGILDGCAARGIRVQ
ncbi:hypothetical protein MMC29_000505 [Sticta canariensis]|nr:hypothetical protein [Sticta canariensis]